MQLVTYSHHPATGGGGWSQPLPAELDGSQTLVLGEQAEAELETAACQLPAGSGPVGFYSYGEISPAGGRDSRLHNQALTVSVLWERPA